MTNPSRPDPRIPHKTVKSIPYIWIVVGLALVGQMGFSWPGNGVPVLYPFIREEMNLSRAEVGLISSALAGGGIMTVFLGGWITDVVGVKRVMAVVLTTLAVVMAIFPLASSFAVVVFLAVLLGMMDGPGYPAITRAIMDWIPARIRGSVMSLRMSGSPLTGVLASLILPAVAIAAGWRVGALGVAGLILSMSIIFFLLYREAPRSTFTAPRMGIATFRSLIRNRGLVIVTIWGSILMGVQVIVLTYFIIYLIEGMDITPVLAGSYMAVAQVSNILGRTLWGTISDFLFGARRLIILIIIGLLAGPSLMGVSLIHSGTPTIVVLFLAGAIGATVMAYMGVFTIFIGELAGIARTGTALGLVNSAMRVCIMVLPPLFGLVVDMTGSYRTAWAGATGLVLIATVILMLFGKEPELGSHSQAGV